MKHLRKIFESNEDDRKYIEECFLDVLENPNFEVDDLLEVDLTEKVDYPMSVYKLHIEFGKSISLPNPVNSNLYIGMVKTDLDFLKMKNEKVSEILDDIEVAINRVEERFPNSECQIYANRRDEIDVVIIIKN
jgi:hypothetical protein